MKCSDLPWLIQFIIMFYNDKPEDWLLDGIVETKACHLERSHVSKSLMIFIIIHLFFIIYWLTFSRK